MNRDCSVYCQEADYLPGLRPGMLKYNTKRDRDRGQMEDKTPLDQNAFSEPPVYDCPYCGRRNVKYQIIGRSIFDESRNETCFLWFIECSVCNKQSWRLSYDGLPPI